MKSLRALIAGVTLGAVLAFSASGEVSGLVTPPETGVFKAGVGADLANGQCLTCHSVEYVVTQPRMPRSFWKASIEKMRAKFGADIPEDQLAPILDYLVANYGKPDAAPGAVPAAASVAPHPAGAKMIMIQRGCFNCHLIDKKLIGPAYKDVAAKYAGNPDAAARIRKQILQGGSGQWGPIPMPPFAAISEDDIRVITDWVMSQK
jgi:cytochrome c551/c552